MHVPSTRLTLPAVLTAILSPFPSAQGIVQSGPLDPFHGFPAWYEDSNGIRLDLCTADPGLCLLDSPILLGDPTAPFPDNYVGTFPEELFWQRADAAMPTSGGGQALLVLALEAAFLDTIAPGEQISFGRIRVRVDNVVPGETYVVTTPFGIYNLVATAAGPSGINFTGDIGGDPGDFATAMGSDFGPFLIWDSDLPVLDGQGNQYVGNPAIEHTVVGSPFGTNFFRIEGRDIGGPGVNSIETNLFTVLGKLSTSTGGELPPTAAFTASPLFGVAPLTVQFADASAGNILVHSWNFGDGQSASEASPVHVYSAPGVYSVSLVVAGPGGLDSEIRPSLVTVLNPPPLVDFSATPTTGVRPLGVDFTSLSTGGPVTSWSWNFGDGSSSTLANPSHTYTAAGTFTVSLSASGPGGSSNSTQAGLVSVAEPAPVADFVAAPTAGIRPLTVSFTDQSGTGPVTSWSWSFGDGSSSSLQHPSHEYANAGTYAVALTVTGPGGTDTLTRAGYVTVEEPPPIAAFTGVPTSGVRPLTVAFGDQSSGGPVTSWFWSFGDGSSSSEQHPSHTYDSAGQFSVGLTVSGPGGSDSHTEAGFVLVSEQPPQVDFAAVPAAGVAPLDVAFQTSSTGGPVTAWSWAFGDGSSSTERDPLHTYPDAGSYSVSLIAVGPGGSFTATKADHVVVVEPPPSVDFIAAPSSGIRPLEVAFTSLSSGGPVSAWSWDFGDGGSSALQDPSHSYASAGLYTVALTATGPGGIDVETKLDHVQVAEPPPVADFGVSPSVVSVHRPVSFTEVSSGGPVTGRMWDFGDGSSSTSPNPSHAYAAPGLYTVALTFDGPGGSDTEVKLDLIEVTSGHVEESTEPSSSVDLPRQADFSAAPTSGVVPLEVAFTELCAQPASSWLWDFGDGTTSTLQNPTHVYEEVGSYSVSLRASSLLGDEDVTKADLIQVLEVPPIADFTATTTRTPVRGEVGFIDLSSGGPIEVYSWDFGDGSVSSEPSPAHVYTTLGVYSVSLAVSGPGGSDVRTRDAYVLVTKAGLGSEPESPLEADTRKSFQGKRDRFVVDGLDIDRENVDALETGSSDPGGLVDGSFEQPRKLRSSSSSWTSLHGGEAVIRGDAELALPTDGERWAEISAAGTSRALPPSSPGGASTPPRGAAGIAQAFRFDPARPILVFDAAFVLSGDACRELSNDFLSIDISDGVTSHNLHYADSFSDLPAVSRRDGKPSTGVEHVRVDLARLFPEADGSTPLTLSIQVGNGGEDRDPSRAAVDGFRLGPPALALGRGSAARELYTCDLPVLGEPWSARVDSSAFAGARSSLILGRTAAFAGSALLVDPMSREVFTSIVRSNASMDVHMLRIPGNPTLLGRTIHTQAFVLARGGLEACNAIDLRIGF